MKKTLKTLFDFQLFQGNARLAKLISETGAMARELSLDELSLVNAAGDVIDKKDTVNKTITDDF